MRRILTPFVLLLALLALAVPAHAQITVPNTFVADTDALAELVNENFNTLGAAALNRAGGNLTGSLTVAAGVTIDGVDISSMLTPTMITAPALTVNGAATFNGPVTFNGPLTLTLPETSIADGALLARVAAPETITGAWTFASSPTLNNNLSLLGKNTGGTTFALAAIDNSNNVTYGQDNAGITSTTTLAGGGTIAFRVNGGQRAALTSAGLHLESGILFRPDLSGAAFQVGNGANKLYGDQEFRDAVGSTLNGVAEASGTFRWDRAVRWPGVVTPPALPAGNSNNYAPAGLGTAFAIRVTTDAAGSTLTGLAAQPAGSFRLICHAGGAGALTVAGQDAGSSATNQFRNRTVMSAGSCMLYWYDPDSTIWRTVGSPNPNGDGTP